MRSCLASVPAPTWSPSDSITFALPALSASHSGEANASPAITDERIDVAGFFHHLSSPSNMKLGLGFYRHMLTRENFQFARQAGATHLVVHLVDYFKGGAHNPRDNQPTGGDSGWGLT